MSFPFQCYEYIYIYIHNIEMRVWLNGKISLCQGEDAGSIPATRPSH
uniref:ORF46e n=1 Tax=Pinus koraiensis TaxID=88728 RepID=A4QM92_PINKO|nr:ORF46e [Pinus koraiensis]ABP35429.1 ORF46e [Pinus koraiensis]